MERLGSKSITFIYHICSNMFIRAAIDPLTKQRSVKFKLVYICSNIDIMWLNKHSYMWVLDGYTKHVVNICTCMLWRKWPRTHNAMSLDMCCKCKICKGKVKLLKSSKIISSSRYLGFETLSGEVGLYYLISLFFWWYFPFFWISTTFKFYQYCIFIIDTVRECAVLNLVPWGNISL